MGVQYTRTGKSITNGASQSRPRRPSRMFFVMPQNAWRLPLYNRTRRSRERHAEPDAMAGPFNKPRQRHVVQHLVGDRLEAADRANPARIIKKAPAPSASGEPGSSIPGAVRLARPPTSAVGSRSPRTRRTP